MTRTSVMLVTGFLGAGKTTFINQLIKQPGLERTALIINEFGDVDIDASLIERRLETVIELINGCICCVLQGSLAETLRNFGDDQLASIDRVVIETTGLANAGPVLHTIVADEHLSARYRFDRIVTLVDAVNAHGTLDRHPESVEQVAVADVVIVTKSDMAPDLESTMARLTSLNRTGRILVADFARLPASAVLAPTAVPGALRTEFAGSSPGAGYSHDAHIASISITRSKPLSHDQLLHLWARVAEQCGPNLLRVKGLVHVAGKPGPAVIQGAQDAVSEIQWLETWPSDDTRTRLVLIGWDLDRASLASLVADR